MPLTTAVIRDAEPRRHAYELRDSPGLTLRVAPGGTKSWRVRYWQRGAPHNETVGRWPDMGMRAARAERDRIRGLAQQQNIITLADYADEYIENVARPAKRSWREDRRILDNDIIPEIGDRIVAQLDRRDCTRVVDRVRRRGAHEMAAKTYAVLRRVLQAAVERGIRTDNPAAQMGVRQGDPRDRTLGAEELAGWWAALQAPATLPGVRVALSLILATGQRLGEVLDMERRDLDRIDALWVVPAEKAKNGHAHVVPITRWAADLVIEAEALWPGSRRLVPLSASTVREAMRGIVARADLPRATPHDLRRTVATEIAGLGYGRQVQDGILNHVDQSVGAIYDRYAYLEEKRAALEAWCRRLGRITGERNHDVTTAAPGTAQQSGLAGRDDIHKG